MAINAERVDRARPPYIHQADLNWCWAATLEAWTRVDGKWGGVVSQAQWIANTELQPYLHPTTKALNIQTGIPYLATRYSMDVAAYNTGTATGSGSASMSGMRDHLRHSHALAVYQVVPGASSHVVLIYSIGRNTVYYMDPNVGFREGDLAIMCTQPLVLMFRKS
jgi:hypothetical protein